MTRDTRRCPLGGGRGDGTHAGQGDPGVRARGWGQRLGPAPGAGGDTGQDWDRDCGWDRDRDSGWDQRGAAGRDWHRYRDTGRGWEQKLLR